MRSPHTPWKSIKAAEAEFLSVEENERLVNDLCGWGRRSTRLAVWDALEVHEGFGRHRPARTFSEAFAACAGPRRCWADFNLAALRELAPELAGLDYPHWVYEAQATEGERAWVNGMAELDGYADEEQAAWYEYGGLEADEADGWDAEVLEGLLALTGEQAVTEDMIVEETTPLVCLDGGRSTRPAPSSTGGQEISAAAVIAGLRKMGATPSEAKRAAEVALASGLQGADAIMRRALVALTDKGPAPLPAWAWR